MQRWEAQTSWSWQSWQTLKFGCKEIQPLRIRQTSLVRKYAKLSHQTGISPFTKFTSAFNSMNFWMASSDAHLRVSSCAKAAVPMIAPWKSPCLCILPMQYIYIYMDIILQYIDGIRISSAKSHRWNSKFPNDGVSSLNPCPARLKLASTKGDAMVGGPSGIMPSIQDRLCHMWWFTCTSEVMNKIE